jgi:hypothetical protein
LSRRDQKKKRIKTITPIISRLPVHGSVARIPEFGIDGVADEIEKR